MKIYSISEFKDERFLPHELEIKIEDFKKMSPNLYKFTILHLQTKYIEIGNVSTVDAETGRHCERLQITAVAPEIRKCKANYKNGKIKGTSIKLLFEKNNHLIFFKFVPMKWSTVVYVIYDPFK